MRRDGIKKPLRDEIVMNFEKIEYKELW